MIIIVRTISDLVNERLACCIPASQFLQQCDHSCTFNVRVHDPQILERAHSIVELHFAIDQTLPILTFSFYAALEFCHLMLKPGIVIFWCSLDLELVW
jgi:hypothetical protein